MTRKDLILKALENMYSSDLMEVWNAYCSETHNYEYIIHKMDDFDYEFDHVFSGMRPREIIELVNDEFRDFDTSRKYYRGDDEYDVESVYDIEDVVDYDELVEYIDRCDETFGNDELEKALRFSRDKIVEALNNLTIASLIKVHNLYCVNNNDHDSVIYFMTQFNELHSEIVITPLEIAFKIHNGKFNPNSQYWWYNSDSNLVSTSVRDDLPIDVDEIANYIIENDTDFCNPVLKDALENI